jgi:alkyl hydroperoxide reductase subunit AhpF
VTTAFGEQILIAIGEGARAALSAYDYLLARPAAQEP